MGTDTPTVPIKIPFEERAANKLSSWKVILGIAAGLVVSGGSSALYFSSLASKTEVSTLASKDEVTVAIDVAASRVASVERAQAEAVQRLIRVETDQQAMQKQQDRIEDKLDYIIMARQPMRVVPSRDVPEPPAPREP